LKDLATLSDGRRIEMPAFYRRHEEAARGEIGLGTAARTETPCDCTARQDEELQEAFSASGIDAACARAWPCDCRRRERGRIGEDADGKIRARRRLGHVPGATPLKSLEERSCLRSRQREMDYPDLFRLRKHRRP